MPHIAVYIWRCQIVKSCFAVIISDHIKGIVLLYRAIFKEGSQIIDKLEFGTAEFGDFRIGASA